MVTEGLRKDVVDIKAAAAVATQEAAAAKAALILARENHAAELESANSQLTNLKVRCPLGLSIPTCHARRLSVPWA